MRAVLHSVVGIGLLSAASPAQADPVIKRPLAENSYLSPRLPPNTFTLQSAGRSATPPLPDLWGSNFTGLNITQVHLTKSGLPSLGPGQWAMTFSTGNLKPPYANSQNEGFVVMGTWEPNRPNGNTLPNTTKLGVFTPSPLAADMNGPTAFGLMIEPWQGQYATVEHAGVPMLSFRLVNAVAFPPPVAITGITAMNVDPAVAYVDGVLNLFWVEGTTIVRAPITTTPAIPALNITGAAITGTPIVVTDNGQNQHHSPTPLIDALGNCQALLCVRTEQENDYFLQPSIWNPTLLEKLVDTRADNNNSGIAGGVAYMRNTRNLTTMHTLDFCLAFGSRAKVGSGTATVTIHAKSDPSSPVVSSSLYASLTGATPPFKLPGIDGVLGMGAPFFLYGSATSTNADDVGSWSVAVPNLASLFGITLTTQALIIHTATNTATLSNTFELRFYQ